MNDKTKTVCFSGHRVLYDPKQDIEISLENSVRQCIANGAEIFMTGGAIGFDTLAALTVIRLRREFPQIRLVLALPCPPGEQTLKWTAKQKDEYRVIYESADKVNILAKNYTRNCMLDRNKYMVDHSYKLIHYLRFDRGGTKHTVNYAQKQGIELIGI